MPHSRPDITVLLPTYNSGAFLAPAVESILAQTCREFEFIIVDDGSTDATRARLAQYAALDRRVRVIETEHQGISRALNLGLAHAAGTIVFCMNHDDIARPERIERQLAFMQAHPEVAACGSAMQMIDDQGRPTVIAHYPLTHAEMVEAMRRGYSPIGHPTMAMRRDVVIAAGGYRPQFAYAEDFDLLLRLSEQHQLANQPDILLDYRAHSGNATSRHRGEQDLAAKIAWLAAAERRDGKPDPSAGLERLEFADLYRFEMPADQRHAMLIELFRLSMNAYQASADIRRLADAEACLFGHGIPHTAATLGSGRELAKFWLKAGRPLRSIKALGASSIAIIHAPHLIFGTAPRADRATSELVLDWVVHCADPVLPHGSARPAPLPPHAAPMLVEQARAHAVLPAVLRNFPPFAAGDPDFAAAKSAAVTRRRMTMAMTAMLRQQADDLMAAAIGLQAAIVKGPVFARTIYPGLGARPFTDIDLLVAPDAKADLEALLKREGFYLASKEKDADAREWKWLHTDNDALLIEVHTDLVHAPVLRRTMSLTYADIAGKAETPSVQLIVALVNASLGKHFEQLGALADILQAARALSGAEEEQSFAGLVAQTGARLAAVTGLHLAARIFNEPRCFELAAALGPVRYQRLARALVSPAMVRSTMTPRRFVHSWQRQAFRRLLATRTGHSKTLSNAPQPG